MECKLKKILYLLILLLVLPLFVKAFQICGEEELANIKGTYQTCYFNINTFGDATAKPILGADGIPNKEVIDPSFKLRYYCNGDKAYWSPTGKWDWKNCDFEGCKANQISNNQEAILSWQEGTTLDGLTLICWELQKTQKNTVWGAVSTYWDRTISFQTTTTSSTSSTTSTSTTTSTLTSSTTTPFGIPTTTSTTSTTSSSSTTSTTLPIDCKEKLCPNGKIICDSETCPKPFNWGFLLIPLIFIFILSILVVYFLYKK